MAACWIVLALAVFISSDKGDAVYPKQLSDIVETIKEKYHGNEMFSVAVNIPFTATKKDRKPDLDRVLEEDPPDNVKNTINNGGVYIGSWVIAAKRVTGGEHAEFRVLSNVQLLKSKNRDLIVIYTFASPCNDWCTNRYQPAHNILTIVTKLLDWSDYAFTFTKPFRPNQGPTKPLRPNNQNQGPIDYEQTLRNSLKCVADSKAKNKQIGLANIFRCDFLNRSFTCQSCSNGGQVTDWCVKNG